MNISISLLTMNVQHLLEVWVHFDNTKVILHLLATLLHQAGCVLPVFSRLLASVVSEVAEHSVLDVLSRFDHQLVDHLEPDLGHDQEHVPEDELESGPEPDPEHGLGHGLEHEMEHHFECLEHSLILVEQELIV